MLTRQFVQWVSMGRSFGEAKWVSAWVAILCTSQLASGVMASEFVADGDNKVVHVYVIRRKLAGQPIGSVREFAHSALLLKTEKGEFFTLEYMSDSKAHLTKGTPKIIKENKKKKYADIKMEGYVDGKTKVCEWERQLTGKKVDPKYTPEELRTKMQDLMKKYSIWKKEHCHTAQERLREFLGIKQKS